METPFDPIEAEAREQKILLDKGFVFTASGKNYQIKQPRLGTLDYLSEEFLKLDIDHEELRSGDTMRIFQEQKRMISPNVKTCARIVAIAVLNSKWRIRFLTNWYARKFLWTVTPTDLIKLTNIILRASNLMDFTSSITLLSVPEMRTRTTAPQVIEEDQED